MWPVEYWIYNAVVSDSSILPPPPSDIRLGRLPEFDERSRAFGVGPLVAGKVRRSYTWSCLPTLNQGPVGACVGFSVTHEIAARPKPLPVSAQLGMDIYLEAQRIDPWPGESYEGTSVLAGIKIAAGMGYFQEYRWAFGLDDLILALGYKGPAVLGINWHDDMMQTDANGFIRPTGRVAGGHAILANGVNIKKGIVRLHNSWGNGWGINGECFISFSDLDMLLQAGGEACIPVIRSVP